jgi:hypothetical protein
LFSGKKEDAMFEITSRVAEIQDDPVGVLRMFFIRQTASELKVEFIPRTQLLIKVHFTTSIPRRDCMKCELWSILSLFRPLASSSMKKEIDDGTDIFHTIHRLSFKVPAVTVTVFKYRNKIGKIVVKAVPYSVT